MILIAFGANLPGPGGLAPAETCRQAIAAIAGLPGLSLAATSRFYVSEPMPPSGQPPYVNGALRLEGTAEPARLLADLLAIEARFGRARSVANAARSLDLDLIAIDQVMRAPPEADPILPHPRAHERAFVLMPLVDVAPAWRHPRLGQTAAEMLALLPPQGIAPMAPAAG